MLTDSLVLKEVELQDIEQYNELLKYVFQGKSHPNIRNIHQYNTGLPRVLHQPFVESFRLLYSGLPCNLLFDEALGLPWS